MSRLTRTLLSFAALAAAATGQCLNTAGGTVVTLNPTTAWTPDDEGLSSPIPMGFAFPMLGAVAPSFTHVSIDSNGALYLSNGGAPVGSTSYGYADWWGLAGDDPRMAPFWTDLEGTAPTWAVTVDTSVSGVCTVNWIDVNEYFYAGTKSFQARLFASGDVEFSYSPGLTIVGYGASVGISVGNGTLDPEGASDFTQPFSLSSDGIMYEDFGIGLVPLEGKTIHFAPDGLGGYIETTVCSIPSASHTAVGTGCYKYASSFFEYFPSPSFDLSGSSMTMINTGTGYAMLPGISPFLTPGAGATNLALTDDSEAVVTLSAPFNYPGGSTTTLNVCSNGYVSVGSNGTDYFPDVTNFLDAAFTGWWSWHDFNPGAGGMIQFEMVGAIACVTWNAVYDFGTSTPETMQFQFDTSNGNVTMVWSSISGQGNDFLVGYSPGGVSQDPGSMDISASLPASFQVGAVDSPGVALSASPAPISTAVTGTVVTYQTDNMPPLGPGIYVGLNIMSFSGIPAPGIDLSFLGAPGCVALVGTIDFTQTMVGLSPSQGVTLPIPSGITIGTTVYSQSVVLIQPNSQPNGQNAAGLLTSNGIVSVISAF